MNPDTCLSLKCDEKTKKIHNKKIKWEEVVIKDWYDSTVLSDIQPFKYIYQASYSIETTATKVEDLSEIEVTDIKKFSAKKKGNLVYIKMKPEYYNNKKFYPILILKK